MRRNGAVGTFVSVGVLGARSSAHAVTPVAAPAELGDLVVEHDPDIAVLPDVPGDGDAAASRNGRRAAVALAVVEAGAAVVWMIVGRVQWFYNDDWDFLASRRLANVGDLFRPHNEHWVTLPVIAYRVLYAMFGLHTYTPWRVMVLSVHLVAVALVFVVMRRAGVGPWIAFAAASLLALFGAGSADILVPVQVAFTGAFVLGLTQLLLADHDGPLDRRDFWGLAAGVAGLMFSAFSITMAVVVGIAVLLRRGWRVALFHTAPLAGVYLVWFAAIGHRGYDAGYSIHGVARFAATSIYRSALGIAHVWPLVIVLALVLAVGSVLAVRQHAVRGGLAELAVPAGLAVGALAFAVSTSAARAELGVDFAGERRYVYLVAAMFLPALAVAADALSRARRWLVPVVVVLLLASIPANVVSARNTENRAEPAEHGARDMMLAVAQDPSAPIVPRDLHPEPIRALPVTVGWLLDATRRGHIPAATRVQTLYERSANFRLAFAQSSGPAPTTDCRTVTTPTLLHLEPGDVIGISRNTVQMWPLFIPPRYATFPLVFFPVDGNRLEVLHQPGPTIVGPVTAPWNWRVLRADTHTPATVCIQHRST